MTIAKRIHLFPYRTQKLSSSALMILGGRPPGKAGRCRLFWSHGQAVKTPPFHGGNRGSIPRGITKPNLLQMKQVFYCIKRIVYITKGITYISNSFCYVYNPFNTIKNLLHLKQVRFGDPTGNRTPVTAVKGRCLDRLTMGPK